MFLRCNRVCFIIFLFCQNASESGKNIAYLQHHKSRMQPLRIRKAKKSENNDASWKKDKSALSASLWTFVQLVLTACGAVRSESESGQMHPFLKFLLHHQRSPTSEDTGLLLELDLAHTGHIKNKSEQSHRFLRPVLLCFSPFHLPQKNPAFNRLHTYLCRVHKTVMAQTPAFSRQHTPRPAPAPAWYRPPHGSSLSIHSPAAPQTFRQ